MRDTILVVEDEPLTASILIEDLQEHGYKTRCAGSGEEAWRLLMETPDGFDAILLDRMMPDMDGLEILRRIKAHMDLLDTPVIMQTALSGEADVIEGLRAGAYYYLSKPYAVETLVTIVAAAVNDHRHHLELKEQSRQAVRTLNCLRKAELVFRTPGEARDLAPLIASVAPDPARVVLGLSELMLNAVEHGLLGISYQEKSRLMREGRLAAEIDHRLGLPEHADKFASLEFERVPEEIRFLIRDSGPGFDWQPYLEMRPERATDPNGRGIAMSKLISFDHLEYLGCGNTVLAVVYV